MTKFAKLHIIVICNLLASALVPVGTEDVYAKAYRSVMHGNRKVLKVGLISGLDVEHRYRDGETLLMLAVGYGQTLIMQDLVKAGARPETLDMFGIDAFNYAIIGCQPKAVSLLLKYGVNANGKAPNDTLGGDSRPIHRAVQVRSVTILKLLLDSGADIKANDLAGRTPLDLAERSGNQRVVKFLRANGAIRSKERRKIPLIFCEELDLIESKARRFSRLGITQ